MPGCEGVPAYAIDGPPGLCVCAARLGAFGDPPDIVVSGINSGCNTGRAILHSGTVGAALTAQSFGCSALAVSVDVSDPWRFDTAARVALDVLPMLLDAPPRSVLNLNVPARPYDEVGRALGAARRVRSVRARGGEAGEGGLQFELPRPAPSRRPTPIRASSTRASRRSRRSSASRKRGRPRTGAAATSRRMSCRAQWSKPCTRCPTPPARACCTDRCMRAPSPRRSDITRVRARDAAPMAKYTREELQRAHDNYLAVAQEAGRTSDWPPWADLHRGRRLHRAPLRHDAGSREHLRVDHRRRWPSGRTPR